MRNPNNSLLRIDLEQNTKGAGEQDAYFLLPRSTFAERVGHIEQCQVSIPYSLTPPRSTR